MHRFADNLRFCLAEIRFKCFITALVNTIFILIENRTDKRINQGL